jgi:hypothetical protein
VKLRPSENGQRPGEEGHERMCEGWKSLSLLSLLLVNLLSLIFIFSKKEIIPHTDKKENKIFLIYKEIQIGSGANYEEGLPNI